MSLATVVTAIGSRIAKVLSNASTEKMEAEENQAIWIISTRNRRERMCIQHLIDDLPREHPPAPYDVMIWSKKRNKEKYEGTWHVRASSEKRAKLTAIREAMHFHTSVRAGSVTRVGGNR